MNAVDLLSRLRSDNIRLWAENDQLRLSIPKGGITDDLLAEIRKNKDELLNLVKITERFRRAVPLFPVERTDTLRLSFAQQRLWFLDQMGTGSAYNTRLAIRLKGLPNIKALEESLNEIIRRHEALRTTFRSAGGRPVQVIAENISFKMPLIDLSGQPRSEREVEAERLTRDEAMRRFDLIKGPLFSAALIRLSEEEHILVLTMHHIVSDGWSMGVFIAELAALYRAFCNGEASPLPELPIQYADFAHWQREWLQGEVLEIQLSYWRKQLKGVPVLQLFTDRPRPSVQTFAGASQNIGLSPTLTGALNDLSQRQGVTLFMTLLAAFQTLLFRYTGQEDIVVGSPIANRNRAEIEGLIGFFVNSLAMRTDLSGNPSFLELLRRLGKVAFGAFAHQDLPFEKLVEELHPERDMSRTPLFQIMFALQNMPVEEVQLPGLTLSSFAIESSTVRFDIEIHLWEKPEGLSGRVVYNTDLFDDATIARLMGHYETLLESIIADPDQRISGVPILTDTERKQLLIDWNDTSSKYPRDHCVHQLFEQQVEQSPDAVAVVYEDEQLTYQEINFRANQLAHYLRSQGIGPDTPVAILVERSCEMVVGWLGILKAGGAYVPMDPSYPEQRLALMLKDSKAPVLLTMESMKDRVPDYQGRILSLDSDTDELEGQPVTNPCVRVSAINLAYVIYTSGSTGEPKGVAIPHRAVNRLVCNTDYLQIEASDRVAQASNASFDASTFEIWGALLHGARLVGVPREMTLNLKVFADFLDRRRITVMFITTALFNQMAREAPGAFCGLRALLFGGEAVDPSWVRQVLSNGPPQRLLHVYGPTETTTFATWYEVEEVPEGALTVPIGIPIANTQAYILDRDLRPVPIGVAGELYMGGDGLGRGYLNRPELTAEKFIPDPFSEDPAARSYKTGDLARYLPDGSIEFLGRIDHQVKIRGFRIELGEVESVLGRHPAIEEAVVIAREDVPGDKRLVAYVVVSHEPTPTFGELRSFLKEKLPDYMIPSALVLLDLLPLTPNGKVDRQALPASDLVRPDLQGAFVAPRSQSEELVAGIWSNVLGVERIGVYDSFFELGGHSLLVIQINSRIRKVFEVELPLRELFEAPTVAGLTERIEAARSSDEGLPTSPLQAVSRDQALPLSFAQERLWFLHHLEPDSAAYSMPRSIRLKGVLRKDALEKSYVELARRHETLRTSFHSTEGNPVLRIAAEPNIVFDTVDLRHLPDVEREAEAKRLRGEDARKPFDLRRDPLFRIRLFQLEDEAHVLHFNMHHIISDGWSFGVMAREIAALYTAFTQDKPADLPELPVQYADYAVWQRQWLQGEALAAQLNYWKDKLGGELPVLELPTDRPRPAVQTHRGAIESLVLPEELTEALQAMSRREGVTLFMTLLAAFKTLLYRHTGQEEIIVGTPIAGRNRTELEGLIGFFMNTIVIRTDLAGLPTFRELLGRVRETALGAYAHQDMPFEKLVEELAPERDLSRTPLFQVFFNHIVAMGDKAAELPGLEAEAVGGLDLESKFDMTLYVFEDEGEISLHSLYNTDLFDASTITWMLAHFETLLEGIADDPDHCISAIPLLTETTRQNLSTKGNTIQPTKSFANIKAAEIDQSLQGRFMQQVKSYPDNIAVKTRKYEWTYQELNLEANRIAKRVLTECGDKEERIALLFGHDAPMIASLLGALKAGKTYVPLDPSYPVERLSYILEDSNACAVLTDSLNVDLAEALTWKKVQLINIDDKPSAPSFENVEVSVTPDALAYILYTSGSTGLPKGVMQNHRNVMHFIRVYTNNLHISEDDRLTLISSYSFDGAIMDIFGALLNGSTLYPINIKEETSESIFQWLIDQEITLYHSTPTVYRYLLSSFDIQKKFPKIRLVVLGGEEVFRQDVELYQKHFEPDCIFINGLGPSESTVTLQYLINGETEISQTTVPVGYPVEETEILLLNDAGEEAEVYGEISIRSPHIALGYWQKPGLTNKVFLPDPEGGNKRIYRSGDMGRLLPDGSIEFAGRKDFQVKIRGFRIEVGEIEVVLGQHPAVGEVVVVPGEDSHGDRQLVAYLVTNQNPSPSVSEIRSFLKQKLPEYMIPSAFVFLDALPHTPNGKVDRQALPKADVVRPELQEAFVAPRSQSEELVAGIWSNVLGLERIGVHDNFFELGGHSLLATRVVSRIQQEFQVDLKLMDFFKMPTIAELTKGIEGLLWINNGRPGDDEAELQDREEWVV